MSEEIEDIIFNTIVDVIGDKIDASTIKNINTKKVKRQLYEKITAQIFYTLLKEQRIQLLPGFGSIAIHVRKEKDKKIYDRKLKHVVVKHVKGKKIVYVPGDLIKEFL